MRRLLAILAAAPVLALSAPALASPAASARVTNSDNCTPTLNYCDELLVAQSGGNNVWIYGNTHNISMVGSTGSATPSLWTPVGPSEPGWYYVNTQTNLLYWTAANVSGELTEIFPEGYSAGDTHQWWHLEPSGTSHIIENYWATTHNGVYCCENQTVPEDLEFSNGQGDNELWNFRM